MRKPLIYNPSESNTSFDKYRKLDPSGVEHYESYTDIFCDTSIEAVYNKTIDNLWSLLRTPEKFKDSTITVVYGASEEVEIPLKITAYLVPIIKILSNLQTYGIELPSVKVVYASGAGIYINQYQEHAVRERGIQIFNILFNFITSFYPDLIEHFNFENDRMEGYQESQLFKSVNSDIQTITDKTSLKAIKIIKKLGMKRGHNEESIYQYIATHPFTFGDILCPEIIEHNDTGFKISIGGPPERLFGIARYALAQGQPDTRQETIQLLTSIGKRPIYYSDPSDALFQNTPIVTEECRELEQIYTLVSKQTYLDWARTLNP